MLREGPPEGLARRIGRTAQLRDPILMPEAQPLRQVGELFPVQQPAIESMEPLMTFQLAQVHPRPPGERTAPRPQVDVDRPHVSILSIDGTDARNSRMCMSEHWDGMQHNVS